MEKAKAEARGTEGRTEITETDLAQDRMGDNSLQGNDQARVRNERHAVPDVKQDTDGIVEGLEKLDKDVRAQRDLGKGNRYRRGHAYNTDDDAPSD